MYSVKFKPFNSEGKLYVENTLDYNKDCYKKLKEHMIKNYGARCSVSELLLDDFTLEHVIPKDYKPQFKDDSSNLVLCSSYCNSKKGSKREPVFSIYDKDLHRKIKLNKVNFSLFPSSDLNLEDTEKVKNTIDLYDLNNKYLIERRKKFYDGLFIKKGSQIKLNEDVFLYYLELIDSGLLDDKSLDFPSFLMNEGINEIDEFRERVITSYYERCE